jgi:hypothetical protein
MRAIERQKESIIHMFEERIEITQQGMFSRTFEEIIQMNLVAPPVTPLLEK